MDSSKRVTDTIWAKLLILASQILEHARGTFADVMPFFNILLELDANRFFSDQTVINYIFDKALTVSFSKESQYQDIIEAQIMVQLIIQ